MQSSMSEERIDLICLRAELIALLQEALRWCCSLEMADVFLVKFNMHNDAAKTSLLLVLCLSCAFIKFCTRAIEVQCAITWSHLQPGCFDPSAK